MKKGDRGRGYDIMGHGYCFPCAQNSVQCTTTIRTSIILRIDIIR